MFLKSWEETKHFKQKPFIFTDVYKIKIDNFSFKHITGNVANGHSSCEPTFMGCEHLHVVSMYEKFLTIK